MSTSTGERRQRSTRSARDAMRLEPWYVFFFFLMNTNDYITDKLQHVNNRATTTVTTRARDVLYFIFLNDY